MTEHKKPAGRTGNNFENTGKGLVDVKRAVRFNSDPTSRSYFDSGLYEMFKDQELTDYPKEEE